MKHTVIIERVIAELPKWKSSLGVSLGKSIEKCFSIECFFCQFSLPYWWKIGKKSCVYCFTMLIRRLKMCLPEIFVKQKWWNGVGVEKNIQAKYEPFEPIIYTYISVPVTCPSHDANKDIFTAVDVLWRENHGKGP